MRVNKKWILIITLTMLVITGCSDKNKKLNEFNYATAARIEFNEEVYEVNKCIDEDTVILTKDGKVTKVLKDREFSGPTDILELGDTKDKFNMKEKKQIISNTWESDLEEGTEYINFLVYKGYSIKFVANTEKFIEIYLENTGGKYKRVIITEDKLIEADVDSILFKDIQDYII